MPKAEKYFTCPDCAVLIGQIHSQNCDVERCMKCGYQRITCDCKQLEGDVRQPWSGFWPGVEQCQKFNLWAKRNENGVGWVSCDEGDPKSREDLNKLYEEFKWNPKSMEFEK